MFAVALNPPVTLGAVPHDTPRPQILKIRIAAIADKRTHTHNQIGHVYPPSSAGIARITGSNRRRSTAGTMPASSIRIMHPGTSPGRT